MIPKIIKIIKRVFGHPVKVYPIIDKTVYEPNEKSWSGNSLQSSNVLIVGNDEELIGSATDRYKKEGCSFATIIKQGIITVEDIEKARLEIIGNFEHIVNIVRATDDTGLFKSNVYNNSDLERMIYASMQIETDYLVKLHHSSLHTVLIKNNDVEFMDILSHSIKHMMRGLARPLLNHNVVTNGIVAEASVPKDAILNTLMFITGKYGEVVAGEVFELKDNE